MSKGGGGTSNTPLKKHQKLGHKNAIKVIKHKNRRTPPSSHPHLKNLKTTMLFFFNLHYLFFILLLEIRLRHRDHGGRRLAGHLKHANHGLEVNRRKTNLRKVRET
jgi:hypothetical protein